MTVLGVLFDSEERAVTTARLDGYLVFATDALTTSLTYVAIQINNAAPVTSQVYALKQGQYGPKNNKQVLWEWHLLRAVTGPSS